MAGIFLLSDGNHSSGFPAAEKAQQKPAAAAPALLPGYPLLPRLCRQIRCSYASRPDPDGRSRPSFEILNKTAALAQKGTGHLKIPGSPLRSQNLLRFLGKNQTSSPCLFLFRASAQSPASEERHIIFHSAGFAESSVIGIKGTSFSGI